MLKGIVVVPKSGKEKEAMAQIIREMNRIGQFGFTESEFKHAKEAYKASLDNLYNNRATITNDDYAQALIKNFLEGEPYSTIEQVYEMYNQILPMLPLASINELAKSLINVNEKKFCHQRP